MKIRSLNIEEAEKSNLVTYFNDSKEYLKNLNKFVSKEIKNNKIKVLFNAMHGVTGEYMSAMAKMYKLNKFTMINDDVDIFFEHKLPSPSEKTLEEFKKEVVKGKYTIGLACDGDGDRLGVIDEKGEYYSANTILAILYYYLVKYRGFSGDIVKTISTSNILDMLAETMGYKCHQCLVGFKYVSPLMNETDALIGGESSGGLTMRGYTPCKDSLFAISLVLDAIAVIKKPLSKIVEEVKSYCGYISTFVEDVIYFKNRKAILNALKKNVPNFSYKPVEVLTDEGYKYIFEDKSWVLIRFSGTENLIRYYVEFPTEIECERNIKALKKFVESCDK